jgi:serine/threonine protein kinase
MQPANLLLTHDGHLKLVDFGTACLDQCTLVPHAFLEAVKNMKLESKS